MQVANLLHILYNIYAGPFPTHALILYIVYTSIYIKKIIKNIKM